jgi:hypothetical protein
MNALDDQPAPDRRNVMVGLVVVLAFGTALALWLFVPKLLPGGGPTVTYSVYFPGQTALDTKSRLVFNRRRMGEIARVLPPQPGLQLTVVPVRAPEVPEAATLLVGGRATLGNGAEITLESGSRAVIRWQTATIVAERTNPGEWTLTVPGSVPPVTRNGGPIVVAGARGSEPLRPGDWLGFGAGAQAIRVYWSDVDFVTRVDLNVRAGTLAKAASGDSAGKLGPGSAVAVLSGFGHPQPELELRPSLYRGGPAVRVSPAPRRVEGDSIARYELTPIVSVDPLALLAQLTSYLGTPAGMRQPPSNRIERTIADAGLTAANLAGFSGQLDRAGKGEDPGVVMRLALDARTQQQVSALLGNAGNVTGEAASLTRTLAVGTGDPAARGRLLDQLLGSGYGSLLGALGNANGAAANANRLSSQLVRDSATIDSTLRNVNSITTGLAGNRGRIDTTLLNVQRVSAGLVRLDSTVTATGPTLRKAKKPAVIATVAIIGLSILNGLKSLVR